MILISMLCVALAYIAVSCIFTMVRIPSSILRVLHPEILTVLFALTACITLALYVYNSERWQNSTEIAWTGLSATTSQPVILGGVGSNTIVGWPNGTFAPYVRLSSSGDLETGGGGGFVLDGFKRVLNGTRLVGGPPVDYNGYRIQVRRSWNLVDRRLYILRPASDDVLASITLRALGSDKTIELVPALEEDSIRLRAEHRADEAGSLERWANDLVLFVPACRLLKIGCLFDREFNITDRRSFKTKISLPATLTVRWPHGSIPVNISETDGLLRVNFPPPWRLSSPLPSRNVLETSGDHITVTDHALPGDVAFVLPLGETTRGLRQDLSISGDRFTNCAKSQSSDPLSPNLEPAETAPGIAVTCRQSVESGRIRFDISTVEDLPHVGTIFVGLVLAFINLCIGLRFCLRKLDQRDRWTICGLVLTAFLFLEVRAFLALRHAADPAYLDSLALGGVTYAFMALAVVPGVILLVARLRTDSVSDLAKEGGTKSTLPKLLVYGLLLAISALLEAFIVRNLWTNIPPDYSPVGTFGGVMVASGTAIAIFLLFALLTVFLYVIEPMDLERELKPHTATAVRLLKIPTVMVWDLLERATHQLADLVWKTAQPTRPNPVRSVGNRIVIENVDRWAFVKQYGIVLLLYALVYSFVLLAVFLNVVGTAKYLQEVVFPLVLSWVPACVLVGARIALPAGAPVRTGRTLAVIGTIMVLSVIALPFASNDVGGIVATVSVFLPASILLALGGRPWQVRWVPILVFLIGTFAATLALMQLNVTIGPISSIGQTAGARVLIWKRGVSAQELLLWARATKSGKTPVPVSVRKLRDAMEHSQENKMMAHEGSWLGLGFANAPSRMSAVRQDTLQYDSTYSFFITGEHGLAGGLALLLIYFMPLILVLASARRQFDAGHGVAIIASSAFLIAALAHASMNLGVLPYTGRNLPFLSVNSQSDLLLWLIAFVVMTQAVLWRTTGSEGVFRPGSLLENVEDKVPLRKFVRACGAILLIPVLLFSATAYTGFQIVHDKNLAAGFDWNGMLTAVNKLIQLNQLWFDPDLKIIRTRAPIPPDTVIGQEIELFNALPTEERLEGTFPHGPADFQKKLAKITSIDAFDNLMQELKVQGQGPLSRRHPSLFEVFPPDEYADVDHTLKFYEPHFRLAANPAYNTFVSFLSGKGPQDFPHVALRDGVSGIFALRATGIEVRLPNRPDRAKEDRIVILAQTKGAMRIERDTNENGSRFRLFLRYHPRGKGANVSREFGRGEVRQDGLYFAPEKLKIQRRNRGRLPAKAMTSGKMERLDEGDIIETTDALDEGFQPSLTISKSTRGALVGAAWVRGHWAAAYDPDPNVPWTRYLLGSLSAAWRSLGDDLAAKQFGSLTLDRALQAAAQDFTLNKGRLRHRQLLQAYGAKEALPPRIAISVLDLPSGGTLALGGWPRMNSGPNWLSSAQADIPSVEWVERRAPRQLRRRYGGDRNFDRMLMGSSTKPIFASVVLAIHKNLDHQLLVTGAASQDDDRVFGIPIEGGGWEVPNSIGLDGKGWCDFKAYLARSDNRYHIRLGFLGLASPGPENTIAGVEHPTSPSDEESVSGNPTPWRHYPMFSEDILFGYAKPNKLENLATTQFADRLSKMYRIGVQRGDLTMRYSFWTGDEQDDLPHATDELPRWKRRFAPISPEVPQFALDRLESPRGFVSLLLGGDENMWANVDFASAFATCISGYPVQARISNATGSKTTRVEFPEISAKMRPGLQAVVLHPKGTAFIHLKTAGALRLIENSGYEVYAKTGTLSEEANKPSTSRIVLALVKWNGTQIRKGLVFSLVIERGQVGMAADWLGEFLTTNWDKITTFL